MRKFKSRHFVSLLAIIAGSLVASPIAWAQTCTYQVSQKYYNSNRHVYGAVNTECSGWPHTPPWGNWGVESNYTFPWDGTQFQGWFWYSPTHQWNSCTTGAGGTYSAPNVNYYNHASFSEQWRAQSNLFMSRLYTTPSELIPCGVFEDTVITLNNIWMELWELDPVCCDQEIADIYYPGINVPIDCPPDCSAESAWVNPSSASPNVASARVKVTIDVVFWSP